MTNQTISQSLLGRLQPGKDQFIRDKKLPGFGIRMNPKGTISFIAEGRIRKGGSVRLVIGKHPAMPVDTARQLAATQLQLMQQGIDPRKHSSEQQHNQARAEAKKEALSVKLGSVLERYLKARTLKPKTVSDYQSTYRSCFADWLGSPIRSITRHSVEDRFVHLRDNKGQATATKAMRYLSAICNWAMADEIDGERLLKDNPVQVLKQKRYSRSVPGRTDYLTDEQVSGLIHYAYTRRSWMETPADGVTDQGLAYVLLLLLTGLRKNEALSLKWSDVDWDKRFFLIRDTKNKRDHVIPMSGHVERLLQERLAAAGGSEWVFPSTKSKTGHMVEPSSQLEVICKATGLSFRLHDLRRTFATHARMHGADHELVKKALNHSDGDVTDSYIQGRLELIRPVFEKVARGYLLYSEPDVVEEIEEPLKKKQAKRYNKALQKGGKATDEETGVEF